jgi:hypothetical protein
VSEADPQARPGSRALFISYASADRTVADELTAYLEQRGIRCWIAPRDVPPGALYADAIVRAINEARALVLILSHNSTASSHVGKELAAANALLASIVVDPLARRASAYQVAQMYAHRGDRENAFKWLDQARQARDPGYAAYLKCDPLLASLRGDPRYQTLLAQLNLPP